MVGGARAVEHLAHIAIEAEMVPLRNTVLIGRVGDAFGDDGETDQPDHRRRAAITLDDLEWWSGLLAEGRARGTLAPGTFRIRAAMAANTR